MKFNTRLPVSCLKSYLKRSFSNEGKNTNILKPSYFHNPGKEPLSCLTVGRLITEAAEKYGDREAIVSVHQNQRLTFNDLDTQVNKFAAGLLEMGLQRGDRVGIWSFNCSEWCIVSGAVAKAGLMLVNINPAFQSSELEYCLQKVGVKALITASSFKTQNYYQLLLNILPELKTSVPGNINSEKFPTFKSLIIMNEDRLQGSFRYSDIMELGSTSSLEKIKQLEEEIQPDHPWNIQFTSGTTGNAKATLLTHHNTVNNSYGTGKRMELDKKSHRICLQVPFFHCFGCVIGYLASLHYGSTLVLPSPHFKAKESLHAIEKEKCTIVFGTPTMHVDMVSEVKQRNIVLESLETVVTGGAPISEHLCHELYNTLAVKQICSVFGMTETSPVTFQTLPTDSIEQITTTFGYLSDHIEAKVVDSENRIVPMGTPGELCVRGYANMLGYWNDDVSTKKMIGQDHWLKTGSARCYSTHSQPTDGEKKKKLSYFHSLSPEPLLCMNIGQLLDETARKYGDREGLVSVHQGDRLSFQQIHQRVTKLAAGFLEAGLKPGDRVALWGPNTTEWYLTDLAVSKAGLILVNINPAYILSELEYCLNKVQVKMLIVAEKYRNVKYYDTLLEILPELPNCKPGQLKSEKLPHLKSVVSFSKDVLPGAYSFNDVENLATPSSYSFLEQVQSELQPDMPCNIQFTSGTTGKPKAVTLTHHGVVNNTLYQGRCLPINDKHHRICLLSPLFHALANVLGVLSALHFGATLILPSETFSGVESVQTIENEMCTGIIGTPTMYIDMLANAQLIKSASPDFAMCAGAPASRELYEQIMKKLRVKRMSSLYGMTEILGATLSLKSDTFEQMVSTVGRLTPHCEAKVVDSSGKMVPFGTPGELWIRGYNVTPGYWEDEGRTKESFELGNWLKTGDRLILREDGYLEVVGRTKDMIIRGGENIYPKEIEDILVTHPDVVEAEVVGVPHERLGEEVLAAVRLQNGCNTTEDELRSFCKQKMSYYKVPRYVRFVTDYPKTATGKVQKYLVKEMFKNVGKPTST